jgi:hemerythrin-like domain-containing protein
MDAITLLKDDHREVESLFKRFEKAGDRAYVQKRDLVDRMIEALSRHAAIEEQLFYPVTRATVDDVDDVVLESLEEHHVVKWLLDELDGMDPEHERFDAKVTVLIENVRHHVEEEEDEYFPKVRDELGRRALTELGDAMEEARKGAPTKPHPRSPDTPPGNLVAGAAAGLTDRVGDTVSGLAQGGLAAVQDVIDRVRGTRRPRSAPRGSSTTRHAARSVRRGAQGALDDAIDAVKDARDAGETATRKAASATRAGARGAAATARTAKSEAKRTTTSAKRAAGRATSTAKGSASRTASTAKSEAKRTTTTAKRAAARTKSTAKGGATRTTTTAKKAARSTKSAAARAK